MSNARRPEDPQGREPGRHADVLAEVIQDQARREAAREASAIAQREATESGFFLQVSLLVLGTFFFYLLFFSPAWVAPSGTPPVSAAVIDDGLRVSIFITARQIETFRENSGRLPDSIDEAGGGRDGVVYRRLDATTFEISAATRESALTYISTEPLEDFVGASFRVLEGRS